MSIAILCGDHYTAKSFTLHMMLKYHANISFVESIKQDDSLTNMATARFVRLFEYKSEDVIVEKIKSLGVTTVVLAWWPKIVHKINKLGINVINTHPSYLPYNRGKHPYYWALVDGTPFGATIHRVDDGIDTGDLLWQRRVKLDPTDTGESAYHKAASAMCDLLFDHAYEIAHEVFPDGVKQDSSKANHHFAKEFEVPPIENKSERAFVNDLRARTFDNARSGRKIIIDGITYRVHVNLVKDESC